jgi:hypothetical protein
VVEDLNLAKRWGLGADRSTAVEKLMSQTKAERIPGSSVARLTVRSTDAELAASLAQGWVVAYERRVTAHLRASEARAIEVLDTLASDLEKKIEEKRVAWLSFSIKHSGSSPQSASEAVMPCDAESRKLELENTLIRTQLAAIQAIKAKSETSYLRAELQAVFPEDAALALSPSQPDAHLQNYLAEKLVQLTHRRNHTEELLQAYGALRREVLSETIKQLAVRSEVESLQNEWDRLRGELAELQDRIALQKIDLEVGSPAIFQHRRAFPKNVPLMPKALARDLRLGLGLILGGILLLILAARNWPKAPRGGASVIKQRTVEVPGQQGLAFDA